MNLTKYLINRLTPPSGRTENPETKRKILLMTHVVVGYPSLEANWKMLEAMGEADVDLVELQMPFSEPIADGPLFVKANQEALRNGIRWKDYSDLILPDEEFISTIMQVKDALVAASENGKK